MRGPGMAHCAHHSDAIHEFWLRLSFSIISGVTKESVKTVLEWVSLLQLTLETTGSFHFHSTDLRRSAVLGPRSVPLRLLHTPLAFSFICMAVVKYGAISFSRWANLSSPSFSPLYNLHFYFWPGWLSDSFILKTQNIWRTFHIAILLYYVVWEVSFTWSNFLILDLWIRWYVLCFFLLERSIILIMDSFPFCSLF